MTGHFKMLLTLISLLNISSISLVKVAPSCVMTSTTSTCALLTVNLSLSQHCNKSLCWCKISSGTFSKLGLDLGLNPGKFTCKWFTLLYSTRNKCTWWDNPCTRLTNFEAPLLPNCLQKEWGIYRFYRLSGGGHTEWIWRWFSNSESVLKYLFI